jgi:hypothetical protein
MLATQPALEDAAHRELIEAPGEIDEGDEEQQRADGAARRCWRLSLVPSARRAASFAWHAGDVVGGEWWVVRHGGLRARCAAEELKRGETRRNAQGELAFSVIGQRQDNPTLSSMTPLMSASFHRDRETLFPELPSAVPFRQPFHPVNMPKVNPNRDNRDEIRS